MRLICPNCGAQYAVDDRVIPETGRDVQCSSCGHTWFQRHPDHDPELAEELGWEQPQRAPVPPVAEPDRKVEAEPEAATGAAGAADHEDKVARDVAAKPDEGGGAPVSDWEADAPGSDDVAAEKEADDERAPPQMQTSSEEGEPGVEPARRRVDADVLSVLREEAEREQAARRAESSIPEYQPEFAMPEPEPAPRHGTAEYATREPDEYAPYGYTPAGYPAPAPSPSRRGLLPDVEDISSSLEGDEYAPDGRRHLDQETRQLRKRGSRVGVGLALLFFGTMALVYARSDRIAANFPSSAEPLAGYVAKVDAGRIWLDRTLRDFVSGDAPDGGNEG